MMFLLQDQVCNEINVDFVIVKSCLNNIIIFEKRLNEKQCEIKLSCFGEILVYYCVKCKENFVEVCVLSSLIIGEYS